MRTAWRLAVATAGVGIVAMSGVAAAAAPANQLNYTGNDAGYLVDGTAGAQSVSVTVIVPELACSLLNDLGYSSGGIPDVGIFLDPSSTATDAPRAVVDNNCTDPDTQVSQLQLWTSSGYDAAFVDPGDKVTFTVVDNGDDEGLAATTTINGAPGPSATLAPTSIGDVLIGMAWLQDPPGTLANPKFRNAYVNGQPLQQLGDAVTRVAFEHDNVYWKPSQLGKQTQDGSFFSIHPRVGE